MTPTVILWSLISDYSCEHLIQLCLNVNLFFLLCNYFSWILCFTLMKVMIQNNRERNFRSNSVLKVEENSLKTKDCFSETTVWWEDTDECLEQQLRVYRSLTEHELMSEETMEIWTPTARSQSCFLSSASQLNTSISLQFTLSAAPFSSKVTSDCVLIGPAG